MISDRTAHGSNGHATRFQRRERQPARAGSAGGPDGARPGPGAHGSWSRFLTAHARWIVLVTLAVVAVAGGLALAQTPSYVSVAEVLVQAGPGASQPPDMGTEAGVAASGTVLASAAQSLHVPQAGLARGVSVHEPGSTFLLQIKYSDPSPRIAQQRAQAIAQAYVAYRATPSTGPAARARTGTAPAAQSTTPTAALITPAPLPAAPSSPDYAVDLLAGLLAGLALAIGTAALRDYLDDRVRGPLDLEAQSGAPVLALVPDGAGDGGRPARTPDPDSAAAEAYRSVRTRLVQAAPGNGLTLLVTGPAAEDRAGVAANLAAAFAQSGRRTVLVGGDLRTGGARHLFGVTGGDGFAGVLQHRTTVAAALHPSAIAGLQVLPPGPVPRDPAALLEGSACLTVLSEIRRQAEIVVIESPPLLGRPDAGLLADVADHILLVADARRSTRAQVRAAMREIELAPGAISGWVLLAGGPGVRAPAADQLRSGLALVRARAAEITSQVAWRARRTVAR